MQKYLTFKFHAAPLYEVRGNAASNMENSQVPYMETKKSHVCKMLIRTFLQRKGVLKADEGRFILY